MVGLGDFLKSVEKDNLVKLRQNAKSFIEKNMDPKNINTIHHIRTMFLFDLISESLFSLHQGATLENIIKYSNINNLKILYKLDGNPYDEDFQFFINERNEKYTSALLLNLERALNDLIQQDFKSLLCFKYKNYRGEIDDRKAIPYKFYKGSNEYHKEEQMLMEAYDLDKKAIRVFAVNDIIEIY